MTSGSFSLGGETFVAEVIAASKAAALAAETQRKIDLLSSAHMKLMLGTDKKISLFSDTLTETQYTEIKNLLESGDLIPNKAEGIFTKSHPDVSIEDSYIDGDRFFTQESFPKGEIDIGKTQYSKPPQYSLSVSGDELIGKLADIGVEFEGSQQAKKIYREHLMPAAEKSIRTILEGVRLEPLKDARPLNSQSTIFRV